MLDTDVVRQPTVPSAWGLLLWPLLTTLGLFLFAEVARAAPCWAFPPLALLVAYPLWLTARERFLFKRRALLAGVAYETAPTRRFLWGGHFGAAIRVLPAMAFAVLLLAMATRLSAPQWGILFADALLLAALYRFFQQRAARQVRPAMLGAFVRGWPLRWLNLGWLTLAFFSLNFFLIGAPDLRHETWQAVAEQAFAQARPGFACDWLGWAAGGLAAFEQGSWALAQRHIPMLPTLELRLIAWVVFLLQLGLLAFLFTGLLLGVLTLVEARGVRAESLTGDSAAGKTFVLTILVFALPSLYGALLLRDLDPSDFQPPAQEALSWIDPCRAPASAQAEQAQALNAQLQAREAALLREAEGRVARELERLFAPVEAGVEDYLDWYFTVLGEYERLAALMAGNFAHVMAEQLEAYLFTANDFQGRMTRIESALMDDSLHRLAALSQRVHGDLMAHIQTNPCAPFTLNLAHLDAIERDVWRAGSAATAGATVGVATAALSHKVVAGVVAKVAAKQSLQAAAVMSAKLAAKKGGGVVASGLGGGLLCAPAGPWAVLCGIGAATVTWLTVDAIAIEIDEALTRETMRAEILDVLAEEKAALQALLNERHRSLITALAAEIQTAVDGVFIPARDGL